MALGVQYEHQPCGPARWRCLANTSAHFMSAWKVSSLQVAWQVIAKAAGQIELLYTAVCAPRCHAIMKAFMKACLGYF